ncbi:MAG: ribose 5-phosphate isomerase B [Endomicrobiales bacterium]
MKIAFGCDHAGYHHREKLIGFLAAQGHTVRDCGCFGPESCDYPDIAASVAKAVSGGSAERGILLCGTGIGMSIAANKFPGVRAAVCWRDEVAALTAEHNNANILCLPARFAAPEEMMKWIATWLKTPASSEPRHVNRIKKIAGLEGTGRCG